mmetsp:Transcript_5377/g.11806  ORF Transcript_5377/g.11806 Transcript_5377/m.11806 type:complete len:338 (+) Transcript_5377:69-1082(+)
MVLLANRVLTSVCGLLSGANAQWPACSSFLSKQQPLSFLTGVASSLQHGSRTSLPSLIQSQCLANEQGWQEQNCSDTCHSVPTVSDRQCSGLLSSWICSTIQQASTITSVRSFATVPAIGLGSLRDNPQATRQRLRVGRGDSSRRGNTAGRGNKGHNARGRGAHLLYDGGQLGLIKFPVSRERPPYEVLYTQLGLGRVLEYIQLGLLDTSRVITMKNLLDVGCVQGKIKYGVLLYGQLPKLHIPIHIQVTACDDTTKACIEAAGGSVTRVYYTEEGLQALLHPGNYLKKKLPLPLPAHSWHPRFDGKFDAIGQLPPLGTLPTTALPAASSTAASAAA